jgi:hypothetical protein
MGAYEAILAVNVEPAPSRCASPTDQRTSEKKEREGREPGGQGRGRDSRERTAAAPRDLRNLE